MLSANSQSTNGTANRDAYRKRFLCHVHHLLQLGYQSLVPTHFTNAEEDDITGEICKRMKQLTEELPTEKWMAHYSIHDQDPVNDKRNPATGKLRKGKRRPRLDIRLVNKMRIPNARFCVEAKRLYRSNSISEYMDDEGLGAFVGGYYAKEDDAVGMLGYVQADSVAEWVGKIQNKLSTQPNLEKLHTGAIWQSHVFKGGPKHTYKSLHKRQNDAVTLQAFHTLLVFC